MLRYLLSRPIAISMSLLVALALSVLAYRALPVSLLPALDVPQITITVKYPNGSPEEIEQSILKPIRESMLTLSGIKTSESVAQNETGRITLQFEYGTAMDLAYIEANEKIDRLTPILPRTLERPIIFKATTADIPVARIQVSTTAESWVSTSELATKILKRRLEQLDGVGLVDMNGTTSMVIRVEPRYDVMQSLQVTEQQILQAIANANLPLGSLSVKDGNYRYYLKLNADVQTPQDLQRLPVTLPGKQIIQLKELAAIYSEPERPLGFHLYNNEPGIAITVHKQAQARLPELMPQIYAVVNQFKQEYPQHDFAITQDQSLLLTLSIQNLSQALVWGGLIAFAVLFLFMRGWREPVIMGIVLPLSLLLAFALFYLFNISLNIISLSGLALGLGMLVDNSIVVIDSIMLKRKDGLNVIDACVTGTQEVIVPLLSSALTNLAVFAPLILLNGLTGALFFDQAISVAAILSVSLLCTFLVVPLLYLVLIKNKPPAIKPDSWFYLQLLQGYQKSFAWVWQHKRISLLSMSAFIPIAFTLLYVLPKSGFPEIERTETVISIDWNEPIDATECRNRVNALLTANKSLVELTEAEVGYQQFLLSPENFSVQHATVYIKFSSQQAKQTGDQAFQKYLAQNFSRATVTIRNAPNAFEQLFADNQPQLVARLRDVKSKRPLTVNRADSLLQQLTNPLVIKIGKGFEKETMMVVRLNAEKMQLYGITYTTVLDKLKIAFGNYEITSFTDFGAVTPVLFTPFSGDLSQALRELTVPGTDAKPYPLREFVAVQLQENYKYITADAGGVYQSLETETDDLNAFKKSISSLTHATNIIADYSGQWFTNQQTFKQLGFILLVSLALMYFILTAEFESLKQPVLVMLTLPIGIAGGLILLWLTGGTLNIMSGIGLIVVLGVLDNDAILKIDRINRLRKTLTLEVAIHQAGVDRLKPIVMNTFTNVLAITPIIFSAGIGADLQRPVAITTIGGLVVGTFTALYFVPLLYWYFHPNKN
ncbi:MAG: efflux RND transporter permease subunit [Cyclobacteriaceae bacterium]|nr:efflux RND transporter permease subunit [Cyclobacteriaceae bacterium]